jgi:hypothetical protein
MFIKLLLPGVYVDPKIAKVTLNLNVRVFGNET